MKRVIVFAGAVVFLYVGSVFIRAYLWELETAKYLEKALVDIAKPWNEEKIRKEASWWLREKSKLTPSDIARVASEDFGNLVQIQKTPDCNIQQGFDRHSEEKHTYAICTTPLKMEKKNIEIKIRLIQENGAWKINDFISIS